MSAYTNSIFCPLTMAEIEAYAMEQAIEDAEAVSCELWARAEVYQASVVSDAPLANRMAAGRMADILRRASIRADNEMRDAVAATRASHWVFAPRVMEG